MNTNGKSSKQAKAEMHERLKGGAPPQLLRKRGGKTHPLAEARALVSRLVKSNVRLRAHIKLLEGKDRQTAIGEAAAEAVAEANRAESA